MLPQWSRTFPFSQMTTLSPASSAGMAAMVPATPPPTTSRSVSSVVKPASGATRMLLDRLHRGLEDRAETRARPGELLDRLLLPGALHGRDRPVALLRLVLQPGILQRGGHRGAESL